MTDVIINMRRDMLEPAALTLIPQNYTSFLEREAKNSASTGLSFLLSKSCAGAIKTVILCLFFASSL